MSYNMQTCLYHGTVSLIEKIDVSFGKGRKDFGKGFYMFVSKDQAVDMMNKKYKQAKRRGSSDTIRKRLYEIRLNDSILHELNLKIFEYADLEWLDFVLKCRVLQGVPHNYDMVIGHTTDDDVIASINLYLDGVYGDAGSEIAKMNLLQALDVQNLGIQYFVGKQDVLDKVVLDFNEIDRGRYDR